MTRSAVVGVAGVALAAALYLWGPELSFRLHLPVQAVLLQVFFMPSVVTAPPMALGSVEPIYIRAAVLWPAVSAVASLLRLLVRPRAWWAGGLLWVAPLAVVDAWAVVVADPVLYPRVLSWLVGWSALVMVAARVTARR